MEFRILGPVEVWSNDRRVPVTAAKQRTLLAALLLRAGRVMAADELIDRLWDQNPPATARKTLHNYVRRLRVTLAPSGHVTSSPLLLTQPPGYLLRLGDAELDLHRFERLLKEAHHAAADGDAEDAAERLRQALELWRGPALADVASETLHAEATWLDERRLLALEERIEVELGLGRHAELVAELQAMVALHPLRERFRGLLMLALCRTGQQAAALAAYRDARRVLVEELGVEPSVELQRLEHAILVGDPIVAAPAPPPGSAPQEAASPPAAPLRQLPSDIADFTGRPEPIR
jgi:DNA-binding SARP family transcriptional activator